MAVRLTFFCVLNTAVSPSHALTLFNLQQTFEGGAIYYHPHFTDEEVKLER